MVMKTHLKFFAYNWISAPWEVYSFKYMSQKVYESKIDDLENNKLKPSKEKEGNNNKSIKQLNKNKEDFREN